MAIEIIMPKMGESITEGTVIDWTKKVGDKVKKDETILEISTDKVDSEVPSPSSGILIEIIVKPNQTVEVGTVIGLIGVKDEKVNKISKKVESSKKDDNKILKKSDTDSIKSFHKNKLSKTKRFYSPLVRSIAKREGVSNEELDNITGTGRGGRVNKSDILAYISSNVPSESPEITQQSEYSNGVQDKVEEMDVVRKRISEHMISSQKTSAHVYSTVEIDMTNLIDVKEKYSKIYSEKHSIKLTVTALIIDACIKALNRFPLLNTSIKDNNIIHHKNINIGVAVALEDNNLIVPVIKCSEELNLIGISRSLGELSFKARSKNLNLEDVQGSTFTITNPGVFGGLFGIPIINQPNVGILSIGKIQKKPVVKETKYGDSIFIRAMMYATLGYDHRLIDGAYGTKFLSFLSEIIESYNSTIEK